MNVYACKRQYSDSAGMIIVAANDKEEAYSTFLEWDDSENKELHYGKDNRTGQVVIEYNHYPLESWYRLDGVYCSCDRPHVIDEDGMAM